MTTAEQVYFKDLPLNTKITSYLEKNKITIPTPIQRQSIEPILATKDLMGIAQTGTGKTFGFGLPTIERLKDLKGLAIAIVPTRELAQQVQEALEPIAKLFKIKSALLIGGDPINKQIKTLSTNPRLLIGTPGRINDLLERKKLSLRQTEILILDEADRMFDMGFAEQITAILKQTPKTRQTLLFSATMPNAIVHLAKSYMTDPVHVEIETCEKSKPKIEQTAYVLAGMSKPKLLLEILGEFDDTAIVFSRTKRGASNIVHRLREANHKAIEIHSDRTQAQRRQALQGFKDGKYKILVATDIAARGIDVEAVGMVINYDFPEASEDYVHRIGRTGRAGKSGKAVSFVGPNDQKTFNVVKSLFEEPIPTESYGSKIASQGRGRGRLGGRVRRRR